MATNENRNVYSGNRYAHDIQQAKAMRRSQRGFGGGGGGGGSGKSNSERSVDKDDKKRLTLDDVQLALKGLEEAESQRDNNDNKQSALRLYELSLEVLILFLKDDEHCKRTGVDPSTVAERVKVALSDAEELKAQLPKSVTTATANEPRQSSLVSGMISSLTNALMGPAQKPAMTTNNTPLSCNVSPVGPKKEDVAPTTVMPTKKPKKKKVATTPSTLNVASDAQISPQSATSKGSSTSKKTTLRLGDQVRDQLYKAVLDDLYMEPEKIQETSWDDIAGLQNVKQSLQESAILPLVRPDLFTGLRKPQNILLWGPPGTGKTMLVRAVAKESGSSLFACSASSLTSKWMGEAEKLVKALFQVALDISPSIVFLDEVDAVLSARKSDGEHEASRRLKTEFMIQMEGIASGENRVLVLACTNCPWDIDSAVLRRFPRRIFVPLPDAAARRALLKILLQKAGKHSIKKKSQRDDLVKRLEGFSCSDIAAIASEASFGPIRALGGLAAVKGAKATDVRPINSADFEDAIRKATKSVSDAQLQKFESWRREQSAA